MVPGTALSNLRLKAGLEESVLAYLALHLPPQEGLRGDPGLRKLDRLNRGPGERSCVAEFRSGASHRGRPPQRPVDCRASS